jgi:DNA-binding NtrC family response regulator
MKRKKIMICDDDSGILEVLEMMLSMDGYDVRTESKSTNLMKEISSAIPDLLLMDLWMPLLSGDQLLKTIRSTKIIKHLPVIILSASLDGNQVAGKAGANAFIAKPFDMDDISVTIQKLLLEKTLIKMI